MPGATSHVLMPLHANKTLPDPPPAAAAGFWLLHSSVAQIDRGCRAVVDLPELLRSYATELLADRYQSFSSTRTCIHVFRQAVSIVSVHTWQITKHVVSLQSSANESGSTVDSTNVVYTNAAHWHHSL